MDYLGAQEIGCELLPPFELATGDTYIPDARTLPLAIISSLRAGVMP